MRNNLNTLYHNARKSLRQLQLGFLLIAIGSLFYFAILIFIAFYIFNISNTWFGVLLPFFLLIIGIITVLMTLRYVLVLFQKINHATNLIDKRDEPELHVLVNEVKNEIGLKKLPKIYVEDVDTIFTSYANQFNALFNPSKINLVLGINHFQTLNRTELKALIKHELSKYKNENEFSLIKFRNWEFSTYNMFYMSELEDQTKITKFKIIFAYIYLAEYFLLKIHRKFSKNIKLFENELVKLNKNKSDKMDIYNTAICKIFEYVIIKNVVDSFLGETLNNFYTIENRFELYREVVKHEHLRKTIIKNYQNSLFNSSMYATEILNYYFQDYMQLELAKVTTKTNYTNDHFHLNNQKKIEQNFSIINNGLKEIKIQDLSEIFEKFYINNSFSEFIETLQNFTEINFEQILYSVLDSSNPLSKEDLMSQEMIDLIKNTKSLTIDYQIISNCNRFEYNGKVYDNHQSKNHLLQLIDSEINKNILLIERFKYNLYIYLKSNQLNGSIPILTKINSYKAKTETSNQLYDELDKLRASIYTELNQQKLNDLYKDFDLTIANIKFSLKELCNDSELNNCIPKNIEDFIIKEVDDNIVYYEKGIYNREAFERLTNLAYWNYNISFLLFVRYKKLYFDLNKDLIN